MPTTQDLVRLFRAISSGDLAHASSVAAEIADAEQARGRQVAAQTLLGALKPNEPRFPGTGTHRSAAAFSPGFLVEEKLGPPLAEVALKPSAKRELSSIVDEWRLRHELVRHGVRRKSKVLFYGPPGCGKTLSARALGRELGLPVRTVLLSNLIGSYLGETGGKLREAFRYAETNSCVLLLDEIDSLARARGRSSDVGELDRVVVSLLQEFDHSTPAGILVAATNRPDVIDAAVWRRFDLVLSFSSPTARDKIAFARKQARSIGMPSHAQFLRTASGAQSYADVERIVMGMARARLVKNLKKGRQDAK